MLKRRLIFLFLIIQVFGFSQNSTKAFKLKWSRPELVTDHVSDSYPVFYFDGAKYNDKYGLIPTFEYVFSTEAIVESVQVELINQHFSLLPEMKIHGTHPALSAIENSISPKYHLKNIDGKTRVQIELVPVKRDDLLDLYSILDAFELQISLTYSENQKLLKKENDFPTSSVLSEGDWYKFKLNRSGMYKISGADLQNAGISLAGLNKKKIGIYGFGGMLNERNADFRYFDLPELAIQVFDGNDGEMDASDYLLFYAEGPDTWSYNSTKGVFEHQKNLYDINAYYFVHIGTQDGKRITSYSVPNQLADEVVSEFTDYAFIESDNYNLIGSGRRWLGDKFEFVDSNSYNFDFDNLIPSSQAYLKAELVARSTVASSFKVQYNSKDLGSVTISSIPSGSYPAYAYDNAFEANFTLDTDAQIKINLIYNRPLSSSIGWLDYFEINVQRPLFFSNKQLQFRNPQTVGEDRISQFTISNTSSSTQVWDISNLTDAIQMPLSVSSTEANMLVETDALKEFIAFTPDLAYTPVFVEQIQNQNLHSIRNVDMLIVCPEEFVNQSNELADFHRNEGLMVSVIPLKTIYNEFSSGSADLTGIRDFVRSVYTNSDESHPLKYLLLFGDASYDYLQRETNNTNLVPTYESYESFDPIISIAVDDYFGFLDADEGDMYYDDVDIGIGRLPVVNAEEADAAVAKIKHYSTPSTDVFGDWRNLICFVADDEDNNLHIRQADDLATMVDTIFKAANLDKIYVDAYQQESTPAGQRYPKVNDAINERVAKGALILSYTGHGGETGWGLERYLDMPDIEGWNNKNKLPVFLTATCEFARYDDPNRVSAGEYIFLKEGGGGIALFTTSRATYAGSNFVMSKYFYDFALNHPDNQYPRMGDILKQTKRASGSGFNVMKFVLLGDPALKFSIPEYTAQISTINQKPWNMESDTLKALSFIEIEGRIQDSEGALLSDFDGFIYPQIYDKWSEVTTLANDPGSSAFTFSIQKNVLYKGKAEVKNGLFYFSFVVPKDIAYNFGKGKLSLYAANDVSDAVGYNRDIVIGGFDDSNEMDNTGPDIQLFLNNENFIDGGLTNQNPILIAKVSDESGINTIGNGIGHDITAVVDNDGTDIKILNDYYEAEINTYKSGSIQYPFSKLDEGEHELKFKVWDIYNNSSTASLRFFVSNSATFILDAIMNYPNPFYDKTWFSFEHNSAQDLKVVIDIYNMNGQLVKQLESQFSPYSSRINNLSWDGTDQHGSKIMKGMYIYRITVTDEDGHEQHKIAKLVYLK